MPQEERHDTIETGKGQIKVGQEVSGEVIASGPIFAQVKLDNGPVVALDRSEVSWFYAVPDMRDLFPTGAPIEEAVFVGTIGQWQRISLRRKGEDPWPAVLARYQVGQRVKCRVRRWIGECLEVEFGNVSGLVPPQELIGQRGIREGSVLELEIRTLDRSQQRIELGFADDPWNRVDELAQVGQVYEGEVTGTQNFGVFVDVVPHLSPCFCALH